jgi:hypothetical protein
MRSISSSPGGDLARGLPALASLLEDAKVAEGSHGTRVQRSSWLRMPASQPVSSDSALPSEAL